MSVIDATAPLHWTALVFFCLFLHTNIKGLMIDNQTTYLIFGLVVIAALILDLGLLSKKNTAITIKKALFQTAFWITLSLAFFCYLWLKKDSIVATKYITAYLMEWSLSID